MVRSGSTALSSSASAGNAATEAATAAARTILFICFISETDCPAALGGASLILAIRSEVRTSEADPGLAKAHCTSEGAGY